MMILTTAAAELERRQLKIEEEKNM